MKSSPWLVVVLFGLAQVAAAKTPFPEFTGARLYVSGVADTYQPLAPEIQRLEKSSPQTYYVAVVQSSGSGQFATRDYLDAMLPAWQAQAARKGLTLDPARSVIIVLAVENRQLSVHTGSVLQMHYGLRDQAIDRQLVQPYFIPHAKAGDYLGGLQSLLEQIDKTIAAKDAQVEQQKQQATARAAELNRNAETTLTSARQLSGDVRKELDAKKGTGVDLSKWEKQVAQASERLDKLDANTPSETKLQEASAAQKQLQEVQAAMAQFAAQQKLGEEALDRVEGTAQELQQAVVEHRRKGLATEAIDARLEETWNQLETSRADLATDPQKVLAMAQTATQRLSSLKGELDRLPELSQQAKQRLENVERERSTLDQEIEKAQQIGAQTTAPREQMKQVDQELAAARDLMKSDYSQALTKLNQLQTTIATQEQQVASAYEQRYFLTRTAPVSGVSILVLLTAAITGGLRLRHSWLKRRVGRDMESYRSEVTRWMERLDGLKQRHQMLPFTDEDFKEPMTGQTMELYNQVEANYQQLRTLWLAMMDRRTKAEGAFDLERPLGVGRLKEVESLLAGREDTTQLGPQYQRCVELLDQLNQAHEEAAKAQKAVEGQREALQRDLKSLADASLSPEALAAELAHREQVFVGGVQTIRSDPLAARKTFESVLNELQVIGGVAQRRLACLAAWRSAQQRIEATVPRVTKLRAEGIKLTEEIANPDPPLTNARDQLAKAWAALQRAEDAAAEKLVAETTEQTSQAVARIDKHLADKEFSLQQLPKLRDALAVLKQQQARAEGEQHELQSHFHPESWRSVAGNVAQASDAITSTSGLIDEAGQDANQQVQKFCQAADVLRQAEAQRQNATALLEVVSQMLKQLQQVRSAALSRQQEVAASQRRLEAFFGQHQGIIGSDAQQLRSQAQAAARQAEAGAGEPRPHWPRVAAAWDHAAQQFSAALSQAEEDVRLHQQLMAELNQARSNAANVDGLLRSNTADRPRANQRFQAAQAAIEQLALAAQRPGAAWGSLLEQLKQARSDLEQARRWAEEDIRLAEQALAALRSAEAEFQSSRTFVSFGVSTNVSGVESQLAQARRALQSQEYEQAISLADAAERAARQAQVEAARIAEERRRRQEEERRRIEMQQMATAAAVVMSSMRSSASASSPASIPSPPSTPTSSSTWSSGTSQSSW